MGVGSVWTARSGRGLVSPRDVMASAAFILRMWHISFSGVQGYLSVAGTGCWPLEISEFGVSGGGP